MTKQWKRFLSMMLTVCMLVVPVVDASAAGQCPEGHELVDGTFCEECGTDYEWYVRENGDNCENEGHDWDMGVCRVCGTKRCDEEGHNWQNGTCSECYIECEHFWCDTENHEYHTHCDSTGKCSICGASHSHNFEYGRCTECYYGKCEHQWSAWSNSQRSCSICDAEETCSEHNWVNGACSTCGKECSHNYDQGVCTTCGAKETCSEHSWSDWSNSQRTCSTCGAEETCSEHNWSDWSNTKRTCSICGEEETCNHYCWVEDSCANCGAVCGVTFAHKWELDDEDNPTICMYCSMSYCEHNWVNGVCTECNAVCSHQWSTSGYCSTCHIDCAHLWRTDGKCSTCGTTCWHIYWENGKCSDCGMPCSGHSWDENGKCENCHLVCEHTSGWTNGKCSQCGLDCTHNYGTAWENGSCKVCGVACPHVSWNNNTGKCNLCQYACKHPGWSNGACSTCGKGCSHNYDQGVCTTCDMADPSSGGEAPEPGEGEECKHNWVNGACTTCQVKCSHENAQGTAVADGECTICGMSVDDPEDAEDDECYHENGWTNGICNDCHEPCFHDDDTGNSAWKNGKCDICGIACTHSNGWDDYTGTCRTCGAACEHTWNAEGMCTKCGYWCRHQAYLEESGWVVYWKNGVCEICKRECQHDFTSDGYCMNGCDVINSDHAHTWESNGSGKCSICQVECSHYLGNWVGGLCQTCGKACEHKWGDDDECTICYSKKPADSQNTCKHATRNTESGQYESITWDRDTQKCTNCGSTTCDHEDGNGWSNGVCEICGAECQHVWMDEGYCRDCGMDKPEECTHSSGWTAGKCNDCGKEACGHDNGNAWSDGVCTICGKVCPHYWMDQGQGYCRDCGVNCNHKDEDGNSTWKDGVCTICSHECGHKFTDNGTSAWCNGVCRVCSTVCSHNDGKAYSDGTCTICGNVCTHYFQDNGYCRDCDVECKHEDHDGNSTWSNSRCTICFKTCDHDGGWQDGCCKICGTGCSHVDEDDNSAWSNGVCTICGQECNHYWYGGQCQNCDKVCTAVDDDGGTCVNCYEPVYTVTVSNTSGARLSGGGLYHENAYATITAEAKAGYTFNGWYDGDEQLTPNLSYGFSVIEEVSYTAKYTANAKFDVHIIGVYGGEFHINGGTTAQGDVQEQYPAGTVLQLTAQEPDRVSAWYNGSGKKLGSGATLTVTVTGPMTIKLSYKNAIPDTAVVRYYSYFDQLIAMNTYSASDTITPPSGPSRAGYVFTDWDLPEEEIKAKIRDGETEIIVKPVYVANGKTYDIYIEWCADGDYTYIQEIPAGTMQELTAKDYDGMTFAYWADSDDNILSYSTTYNVFVNDNLYVKAFYDYQEVTAAPVVTMSGPRAFEDGGKCKIAFTMSYDVPEGYTLVEAGIIRSTSVITPVIGASGVKQHVSRGTGAQGSYTVNVSVGTQTEITINARGYIIVQDPLTGNNTTMYTNVVSGYYDELCAGN